MKSRSTIVFSISLMLTACQQEAPHTPEQMNAPVPRTIMGLELGKSTEKGVERQRISKLKPCVLAGKSDCGNYLSLEGQGVIIFSQAEQATNGHVVTLRLMFKEGTLIHIGVGYDYEAGEFSVAVEKAIARYGGGKDKDGNFFHCDKAGTCLKAEKTTEFDNQTNALTRRPTTWFTAAYWDSNLMSAAAASDSAKRKKDAPNL